MLEFSLTIKLTFLELFWLKIIIFLHIDIKNIIPYIRRWLRLNEVKSRSLIWQNWWHYKYKKTTKSISLYTHTHIYVLHKHTLWKGHVSTQKDSSCLQAKRNQAQNETYQADILILDFPASKNVRSMVL